MRSLCQGVTLMVLTGVGSCIPTGPGTPGTCQGDLGEASAGITLKAQTVVADADQPIALAFAPDGRLFYTEKATGRMRVVSPAGQLLDDPFVDLPVNSNAERGLLGIALHPNFAQNGLLYVFYSRSNTGDDSDGVAQAEDNRVVRFKASGNLADGD